MKWTGSPGLLLPGASEGLGLGGGGKGTGYYSPKYCPPVKEPGTMPSSPGPGGELRPPFPCAAPRRRCGDLLNWLRSSYPHPLGSPDSGAWGAPNGAHGFHDPRTQLLDHPKNINLGSRETFSPGDQVPARQEGLGPHVRSGAGRQRIARPHKTSRPEPETSPEGDVSNGFGQQEDTSPKGFAEIHGDRPRPLRFRGVKLAPTYAGYPFWRARAPSAVKGRA